MTMTIPKSSYLVLPLTGNDWAIPVAEFCQIEVHSSHLRFWIDLMSEVREWEDNHRRDDVNLSLPFDWDGYAASQIPTRSDVIAALGDDLASVLLDRINFYDTVFVLLDKPLPIVSADRLDDDDILRLKSTRLEASAHTIRFVGTDNGEDFYYTPYLYRQQIWDLFKKLP